MQGIFVNENGGIHYAQAIAQGLKPVETRGKNMLSALIGQHVAIIRTRRGKSPVIVGYATISGAQRMGAEWLNENRNLTLIPPGSMYDVKTGGKWCYFLRDAETCAPYPLPSNAVRHGRSWCEFTETGGAEK